MPNQLLRRLKILYVDTEDVWRGGQEQLFDLMTGMKARGHSVWLAAGESSAIFQRAAEAGIVVFGSNQHLELSIPVFLRTLRILKNGQFDIAHSNTPRSIVAVGLAARMAGTPAVFSSRRVDFPLRSRLSAFKYNWGTDRVLAISGSIKKTLTRGGVDPSIIQTIYEGVDLDWIDRQYPEPVTGTNQEPVIGTVAHMSPEKGHSVLLDAFAILRGRFPRVRLCLIGDGSQKDALKEQAKRLDIEGCVTFSGFRTDSEALMKRFELFCLPSLSEGLSSAILNAMASRLAVVATNTGGIPELVSDESTGLLVPPGDPERLAAALGRLLEDSDLCKRMGEAGRERIEDHFTASQKLNAIEKSYLELLHAKGIR